MSSSRRFLTAIGWPLRAALLGLVLAYRRTFGGALAGRCRFHPSCSGYALEAVRRHGAFKGSLLSLWRVLRCSPLSTGGPDPVPHRGGWRPASMMASHEREAAQRVG